MVHQFSDSVLMSEGGNVYHLVWAFLKQGGQSTYQVWDKWMTCQAADPSTTQTLSCEKGKKEPRSKNNIPERDKIRVTLVRLLWRVMATGLKPLRWLRAQRSCNQMTQPLPTNEAAKLGSREGGRRVYSFQTSLRGERSVRGLTSSPS